MTNMNRRELSLHEELLLLALRDREGTTASGNLAFALGGALLAELIVREKLRVVQEGKKSFVAVAGRARVGEPVLDECLQKVRDAKRRATVATWVGRFAGLKQLKHRVAEGLCDLRVLRADEAKVLLLFTRKVYPEGDPGPERALVEQLREAIFGEGRRGRGAALDARTIVLLSLAHRTGILPLVFDKKELKRRKAHIEKLIGGELAGQAAKEAIEAVQAALLVTTLTPVLIAGAS